MKRPDIIVLAFVLAVSSVAAASAQPADARALARRMQAELARIGCYRQPVDGAWGRGSRRALASYLSRTGRNGRSLEPSRRFLDDLVRASASVCAMAAAPRATTAAPRVHKASGSLADDYLSRLPANMRDPGGTAPMIGMN